MTIPRYPEIVLLPKRPEIFAVKEVVACEKLHGSNFRTHFPLGMRNIAEVQFGSHDVEYDPAKQDFALMNVVRWFQQRTDLLTRMWETFQSYGFGEVTVFGEAYGPGMKCKGVRYTTGTEMLYRCFGIMVGENFLSYDLFCEVSDKMGLPRVHEVWRGPPTMENFDALLEKPSTEGKLNGIHDETNVAEGVVIQTLPLLRNVFGEWLIAKHKSRRFSEKAEAKEVKPPRAATPADLVALTYVTEGRLLNALGRLHDRGEALQGSMQDMPVLLGEMTADLIKEVDETEIRAAGKALKGAVSKVLAPLYRDYLAKK